jgi:pimeloyl-ACP methyl ester carboxylesterase
MKKNKVHYNRIILEGLNIFYREAGSVNAPVVLLLHGYPTSSFMFRNLIPKLADKYRVIAPDLPGFGFSDAPARKDFNYTFDNLALAMQGFIDKLGLKKLVIYIFDYGAPVGLRIALNNPEKIRGIISQNGNAYLEGLSTGWTGFQKYWQEPTTENRETLREFISIRVTRFQYEHGVTDNSLIAPETYTLDQHFLDQPEHVEIQLDLILDYRTNVVMYPKFQAYFREYKPPVLAVWGNKDPYFLPAGAEGYKKDNPDAIVKFYDTGHFALETHGEEIGNDILEFLENLTG